jgi:hydrogenase nickel incorporation protein HypA/HybF
VHERAVTATVIGRILELADREHASAVTRVRVRLGPLSHFTPDHFREHFEDAARGTIAEGAAVEAAVSADTTADDADAVVVESVEVEVAD